MLYLLGCCGIVGTDGTVVTGGCGCTGCSGVGFTSSTGAGSRCNVQPHEEHRQRGNYGVAIDFYHQVSPLINKDKV